MSVSEMDVIRVARLARIRIDMLQIPELLDELNEILHFVEQLNEVDCSEIDGTIQYSSVLYERQDVVFASDPAVMSNAPEKENNMFIVPKVTG
ncbi:MAG: Asp-tRNA(Asn)/Glu-tRNA(Gln) amidotransferase subunit GatC [Holosporaceae bacterium]|jgi:aspartyl-tRNA(Asn)/glutamyl-tRNA(Gln) amidotransferase subunit C|nr:Asp-tRNA(Asn)/Glu-tRNA(Gln) amidotransferase subunit GatC [Holosporaceae bacterium]